MPLLATMLPPAQAAIAGESLREDAPSNPQTVPATITEPDHSHDHASTTPRPSTTTSGAPVNEQDPSSDPNIASSSRPLESTPDLFTSHKKWGGEKMKQWEFLFYTSLLVSLLCREKVNTQESELKEHKLRFKEVVGKVGKDAELDVYSYQAGYAAAISVLELQLFCWWFSLVFLFDGRKTSSQRRTLGRREEDMLGVEAVRGNV
ncbi:hypothetical protein Tco_0693840 [Tanacetum coccineum]